MSSQILRSFATYGSPRQDLNDGKIYYTVDFPTLKNGDISLYNQLSVGEIYYLATVVRLWGEGWGPL